MLCWSSSFPAIYAFDCRWWCFGECGRSCSISSKFIFVASWTRVTWMGRRTSDKILWLCDSIDEKRFVAKSSMNSKSIWPSWISSQFDSLLGNSDWMSILISIKIRKTKRVLKKNRTEASEVGKMKKSLEIEKCFALKIDKWGKRWRWRLKRWEKRQR